MRAHAAPRVEYFGAGPPGGRLGGIPTGDHSPKAILIDGGKCVREAKETA